MQLLKLIAIDFRCLKKIEVSFDNLTVLIGENDAGKSSILDLLEICLNNGQVDSRDFCQYEDGSISDTIEVIIEFHLTDDDIEAEKYAMKDLLKTRFLFSDHGTVVKHFVWGEQPLDIRLRDDFTKLKADKQRELVQALSNEVDMKEFSNSEKRVTWLSDFRNKAEKSEQWIEYSGRLSNLLPRFERYSSLDYSTPERMIEKTLRQVYEQTIYEDIERADGSYQRQLIKPLQDVESDAIAQIQEEVSKLTNHIQRYNRRVSHIGYDPSFDYSSSLKSGEFRIDTGRGLHALSRTGAGTRRRMLMGLLDWDREITIEQSKSQDNLPSIIRGYDEPDTNLHYGAQRHMFQVITDIVEADNSRIQAILCTHSLTMIDRASAQNIRHLQLCDQGHSEISQLEIDNDPEVENFLANLARELSITNTLMFYERCFILIEGQTEENALPILYRKLYGRSLLEDGIRIINVRGNGAVKQFLQLLSRNRKDLTVIFVDNDTRTEKTATLTENELRSTGFDDEFIEERMIYVGEKEFEDTFSDKVIADCLQENWQKEDGNSWTTNDIALLRENKKFSDEIIKAAYLETKQPCRKPDLGKKIAEFCCPDDIPEPITGLFALARKIARL